MQRFSQASCWTAWSIWACYALAVFCSMPSRIHQDFGEFTNTFAEGNDADTLTSLSVGVGGSTETADTAPDTSLLPGWVERVRHLRQQRRRARMAVSADAQAAGQSLQHRQASQHSALLADREGGSVDAIRLTPDDEMTVEFSPTATGEFSPASSSTATGGTRSGAVPRSGKSCLRPLSLPTEPKPSAGKRPLNRPIREATHEDVQKLIAALEKGSSPCPSWSRT